MNKTIKKIDKLLAEIGKRSFCAVCGAQPAPLHHILPKSTHPWLRAVIENLLPTCDEHHCTSNDLAAHSSNLEAQMNFNTWLNDNRFSQCKALIPYRLPPKMAIDWGKELATLQARQYEIK